MHSDTLRTRASGPLAGIVIADFSRVLAGPYATMLLADMGALVIKIESPRGDDTRGWLPPVRGEMGTYFLSVNRNKHSIALDLNDADDQAIAEQIVARSDVLVQNFKPGGLARFGLDYPTLAAQYPRLVYASITGFGTGAGADLPGYDLLAQAVSGLMHITGDPGGAPTKTGVAVADVICGLHATTGILAALNARHRTGRGELIEVNLLSSMLSGLVNQSAAVVAAGAVPGRMGNAHPSLTPYESFRTASTDLVIAVGNDGQFARLCGVLGQPEWAQDPRFAAMAARNAHADELRALLGPILATRPADEWFELLRAAAVPAGPIQDVSAGVQLAAHLGLDPVAGTGADRVPTVRHPISYAHTTVDYSHAPPHLDADRPEILRWLSGTG